MLRSEGELRASPAEAHRDAQEETEEEAEVNGGLLSATARCRSGGHNNTFTCSRSTGERNRGDAFFGSVLAASTTILCHTLLGLSRATPWTPPYGVSFLINSLSPSLSLSLSLSFSFSLLSLSYLSPLTPSPPPSCSLAGARAGALLFLMQQAHRETQRNEEGGGTAVKIGCSEHLG